MPVDRVSFGLQTDGSMRLRVSRPGADARNLSLPANLVAFDSSFTVTPKIHVSAFFSIGGGQYPAGPWFRAVTWAALPFRPFLILQFQQQTLPLIRYNANAYIMVRAEADGIFLQSTGTNGLAIEFQYIVLAVEALG